VRGVSAAVGREDLAVAEECRKKSSGAVTLAGVFSNGRVCKPILKANIVAPQTPSMI
jgi:hypothetical protein